jgi:hypothetical protein
MLLSVTGPGPRCVMTTLPRVISPKDPGILRTAATENHADIAVYASVGIKSNAFVGDFDPPTLSRREREKRQRLSRSEREEKTVPVPEGQGPWRGTRNFRFGSSRPYRFTSCRSGPPGGLRNRHSVPMAASTASSRTVVHRSGRAPGTRRSIRSYRARCRAVTSSPPGPHSPPGRAACPRGRSAPATRAGVRADPDLGERDAKAERQQGKTGEAQLIARDHLGEAAVVEELGKPGGRRASGHPLGRYTSDLPSIATGPGVPAGSGVCHRLEREPRECLHAQHPSLPTLPPKHIPLSTAMRDPSSLRARSGRTRRPIRDRSYPPSKSEVLIDCFPPAWDRHAHSRR